jgi:alpha-acetolactate decarboxylase
MLDERWIWALHVEALRQDELHAEREPHVLFQASTIGALLDGAYEGDLTFAELAEHGDLGLGTLNGLDGEMIALDGAFFRADADGAIHPVPPQEKTPFAVEVPGSHLHFIDEERSRGRHVLDSRPSRLRVRLDPSNDLHVELPPRVDLGDPDLSGATHAAVAKVERG